MPTIGSTVPGVPPYPPLVLAPGETVRREWLLSRMKRLGWVDSSLVVTDSRVIYRARAKSFIGFSSNTREVQVADVNGAVLETRRGLTPLSLIILTLAFFTCMAWILVWGIYLAIVAAVMFFLLVGIMVLVVALLYRSKELIFVVCSRNSDSSPIELIGSNRERALGALTNLMTAVFRPTLWFMEWLGLVDASAAMDQADPAATQAMYNEFNALILELQTSR